MAILRWQRQIANLCCPPLLRYRGRDTQVVPEPSTCIMALAGLACGGYSLFRRRRAR
jgi:hypothetical protein